MRRPYPVQGWFVAFWGDGYPPGMGWYATVCRWLVGDGFKHVTAFGFHADLQCWVIVDVTHASTEVVLLHRWQFDYWLAGLKEAGGRVLKVPEVSGARRGPVFGWCVPAVAHLVGVRSRAWRPAALWRDLVAMGAQEVFR